MPSSNPLTVTAPATIATDALAAVARFLAELVLDAEEGGKDERDLPPMHLQGLCGERPLPRRVRPLQRLDAEGLLPKQETVADA